jgi:hypothetical protein
MPDIVKFDFHNDVLDVVQADTRHCVVIRSITEALGLDYNALQNRIRRTEWAKKGSVMMTVPTAGGPQQALCLDIRKVPMLLATIDASRVKPSIRSKVELYQEEAAEALADRFLGRRGETSDRIRALEGNVLELLRRVVDQPNGLLGTNARDLRARMASVAEKRKALGDPNDTLTAVDNEVRMIVDYPRTRGARWEHCPAHVATRAHSYVAAQIDSLDKRIAKAEKSGALKRQLSLVGR